MTNAPNLNVTAIAPDASAEQQALLAFCKASADELRLDILRVLRHDSYGVLELCSIFDCKQSGMSHHLKILASAGLVKNRREGNTIFYRRANRNPSKPLTELQQTLFQVIDEQLTDPALQQKVAEVQQERAANSLAFFNDNADKFRQQQEQIAAYELYGPNAIDLIDRCLNQGAEQSPDKAEQRPNKKVLEIGPGEGVFLGELSPRFKQVFALDNSQQMLEKATQFANQQSLDNIEFIHGDTKHPALRALNADCAVVNMVLHHTPSPAEMFQDLAQCLKPGGQLFVTDLCSHDQSWVQDSCGDVWLGFDPEDLSRWAQDAGFADGENIFLAQRNGFRVQIRQFVKP